jgi:protein-tyrosine phosphatase
MMKKKIIFICHGNICRSPMAEYVMKHLVKEQRRESEFEITSGAVSREEIGNDIYPPAKRKLQEKGVEFSKHRAHQITPDEFSENDIIITMDSSNMRLLGRIVPNWEETGKVHLMMEYAGSTRDVADPWYTGDFEQTYQDVLAGCTGLLNMI